MNFLLDLYIQSISKDDLKKLADQYRIYFSTKEIDLIYPIIKSNWRDYFNNNKQELKEKIIKDTSFDCLKRIEKLIGKLT